MKRFFGYLKYAILLLLLLSLVSCAPESTVASLSFSSSYSDKAKTLAPRYNEVNFWELVISKVTYGENNERILTEKIRESQTDTLWTERVYELPFGLYELQVEARYIDEKNSINCLIGSKSQDITLKQPKESVNITMDANTHKGGRLWLPISLDESNLTSSLAIDSVTLSSSELVNGEETLVPVYTLENALSITTKGTNSYLLTNQGLVLNGSYEPTENDGEGEVCLSSGLYEMILKYTITTGTGTISREYREDVIIRDGQVSRFEVVINQDKSTTLVDSGVVFADTNGKTNLMDSFFKWIDFQDKEENKTENGLKLKSSFNSKLFGPVVVPDTFEEKTVTQLAKSAFINCFDITDITLPTGGLISIGDNAFQNCSKLSSIELPSSLTYLGANSFENCQKLTSIVVPSKINTLKSSTFQGCTALTSVTLPSLTTIEAKAFNGCSSLETITLPSSLTTLGSSAFSKCVALTDITIPDNTTTIGSYAFESCTNLTSVTLPKKLTTIDISTFSYCTSLKEVTIKDKVTSLGDKAFLGCTQLETLTLPSSLTTIGKYVFKDCTSLNNLTLPKNLTTIDSNAFENCTALSSISFPSTLTTIGAGAFKKCSGLQAITIPASVTSVDTGAFQNCTAVTSLTFEGTGLTTLKKQSFDSLPNLNTLNVPEGVTTIEGWAMGSLTALSTLSLPSTLKTMGMEPFSKSYNLRTLTISPTNPYYEVVGDVYLVEKNSSPMRLVYGNGNGNLLKMTSTDNYGIEVIGEGAFAYNYNISGKVAIYIPSSVTRIESFAFERGTQINSVTFTSKNITIDGGAFLNCSNINTVTFPGTEAEFKKCIKTAVTGSNVHPSGSAKTSYTQAETIPYKKFVNSAL